MKPDSWSVQRLREAVVAALEAGPAGELAALERVAAGDSGLVAEARALLAHRVDERFLSPPLRGAAGLLLARAAAERSIGQRFGAYRVTSVVATGGMGAVYRASRDDDAFERTVAIKTVPALLDDPKEEERFARERRLLARLPPHPGIAALLDGGWSQDGVPYLVLEFVEGQPLGEYCAQRGCRVRERVRLVAAVCEAVRHAHQNLVVHGDLKPGNILVTPEGRPKLLDFGVAGLVDGAARGGAGALSPRYASPEQERGEPLTTASDVFSLGVVLYELLTGRPPSEEGLEERGAPARPSLLARGIDADLDAVVLRALALDPAERYPSAEALGDDLARFLAGFPVNARPATAAHRLRKAAARNRAAAVGTCAALVAVAALIGALVWRAVDLAQERDRTAAALASAGAINSFLGATLEAADAGAAEGRELTPLPVAALLDNAAARIDRELAGRPAASGPLHLTLARAYANLGRLRQAAPQVEAAVRDLRAAGEQSAPELADALETRGGQNAGGTGGAADLEEALAIRRRLFGERDPRTLRTMRLLGAAAHTPRRDEILRRALEGYRSLGAPGLEGAATCLEDLADAALVDRDFEAAAARRREALEIARGQNPESDRLATALTRLGEVYTSAGEYGRAEESIREALALGIRMHGADHPTVTFQMLALAGALEGAGRATEAEEQFSSALKIALARLSEDHYIPVVLRHRYGQFLARRGRHAEARQQLSAAYQGCVASMGETSIGARAIARAMAESLEATGNDAALWRTRAGP